MNFNDRISELNLNLPNLGPLPGKFVHAVNSGNMLYLSGKGPQKPDGTNATGKVGQDVSVDEAYQHARLVGLGLIAAMKDALGGDLNRVRRVVKLLGMVNATPDFTQQPKVINGCSDLFYEVFGEQGLHARSAVGMGSLPGNITVEIEAIVEVE